MEVAEVVHGEQASAVARPVPDGTATRWRWIRRALLGSYVVGTLAFLAWWGKVPSDREYLVGWVVVLLLLNCAGRTRRDALVVVASWAPFLVALYAYDFARSVGYRLHRPVIVTPQIELDRVLGFGRLPTEILQERFFEPHSIRWYDVGVSVVYMSHFFVPYAAAGYLWRKGMDTWRWYTGTFVALTFGSCAIYAAWATAPPWYAARQGYIEPFSRVIAGRGWSRVGLQVASRLIEKGQGTVNPFAAIPSLHGAEALLVAVFLWGLAWKPLRVLLALYPAAMCFTLVYSGEHYVVDVLAGWGCVAVLLAAGWYVRRRRGIATPFRWTAAASGPPTRSDPAPADGAGSVFVEPEGASLTSRSAPG